VRVKVESNKREVATKAKIKRRYGIIVEHGYGREEEAKRKRVLEL
jgi:hypothetical protein